MLLLRQPSLLSLRAFLAACLFCFTQAKKDVLFCSSLILINTTPEKIKNGFTWSNQSNLFWPTYILSRPIKTLQPPKPSDYWLFSRKPTMIFYHHSRATFLHFPSYMFYLCKISTTLGVRYWLCAPNFTQILFKHLEQVEISPDTSLTLGNSQHSPTAVKLSYISKFFWGGLRNWDAD